MCGSFSENNEPKVTVKDRHLTPEEELVSSHPEHAMATGGADSTKALPGEDVGSFHPEPTILK